MKDANNAAFAYSVSLLRLLLRMQLITQDEYNRIVAINRTHYEAEICVVWEEDFSGCFRTLAVLYVLP